jgi:hypothetical protein
MKTTSLITILLVAFLLTACGAAPLAPTPDVSLIQTSAANTVIANFTATAKAAVTNTPLAAITAPPATALQTQTPSTPLSPSGATATGAASNTTGTPQFCDYFGWDNGTVDVNVPDGSQMQPGQQFVKTWRIKNIGTCTWGAGYKPFFSYGSAGTSVDPLAGVAQPINGVVGPGQEIEISVQFKAPTKAGEYVSCWAMQNANGTRFFGTSTDRTFVQKPVCVKIVVKI